MNMIDKIMTYNQKFVDDDSYKKYITSKIPKKKIAILTCMDTRLTELLPNALGLENGDAKIIRNAGALVSHPYGSIMRSLLICVYDLGVDDIFVIGHYDCGMKGINPDEFIQKMQKAGITSTNIAKAESEVDFKTWLAGFSDVEESIKKTVKNIAEYPLMPSKVSVYGLVLNPENGKLTRLI